MATLTRRGNSPLPLNIGLTLTAGVAFCAMVVAVIGIPRDSIVAVVIVSLALMVFGSVVHVRVRKAWHDRNARQRAWIESLPTEDLAEFDARVHSREERFDEARQNWFGPMAAAVLLAISALVVPFLMINSLAPDDAAGILTKIWVGVVLALAAGYLVEGVRAAIREDHAGSELSEDLARH